MELGETHIQERRPVINRFSSGVRRLGAFRTLALERQREAYFISLHDT